jgi:hypothetical protein
MRSDTDRELARSSDDYCGLSVKLDVVACLHVFLHIRSSDQAIPLASGPSSEARRAIRFSEM